MNCTRCNKQLIDGVNIYKDWHIPICKDCRQKMIDDNTWGYIDKLTNEEQEKYKDVQKEIIRSILN